MVVLNMFGKIARTCISEKLKLFISNLPNEKGNEWRDELADELYMATQANILYQNKIGTNYPCGIIELYKNIFPDKCPPKNFEKEHFQKLADNMICIYFDYEYSDMPLGGLDTNCFDGRLCEGDYTERIIDFMNYLSNGHGLSQFPSPVPYWIYSSNNNDTIDYYRIFGFDNPVEHYLHSLLQWGKLFDNFLSNREDYILLTYLIDSLYQNRHYNEYHLMKLYSLCQLFLEKNKESELDNKLPLFISNEYTDNEKSEYAKLLRKMRNKIAHGDFMSLENLVEEFAEKFMDGHFYFDYTEYSRRNWVIIHICCLLDEIVILLIHTLFYDREYLIQIKNGSVTK